MYAFSLVAQALERLFLQLSLRQQFLEQAATVTDCGLCHIPTPSKLLKVTNINNLSLTILTVLNCLSSASVLLPR